MRGDKFLRLDVFLNLHPKRGTHWTFYMNDYCFGSFRCPPPKPLTNFVIEKNGKFVFSD